MKTEIKRILIVDDSPKDIELTIATLAENHLAKKSLNTSAPMLNLSLFL